VKVVQNVLRRFPFVHRAIRSVWRPPERIYRHLYFDGVFTVEVSPAASFTMESRGHLLENDLFWSGFANGWEAEPLRLWRELCATSNYILDVGANTGVYALAAQAINPTAKVLAVEPSHRVVERLRRNIAINDFAIEIAEFAASDFDGTATFYDFPADHQYSASLERTMGGSVPLQVEVRRLDTIVRFPRVDLVKMDVERHEPAALRGMQSILRDSRPTLLIEVLDDEAERAVRAELPGTS